jgi:hypothetical protein
LREGELLSDSDPEWARDAYENEPRQSTGGEQDSGPSHPANTKGSGHLGTSTAGSGGGLIYMQAVGVSRTPALATLRALASSCWRARKWEVQGPRDLRLYKLMRIIKKGVFLQDKQTFSKLFAWRRGAKRTQVRATQPPSQLGPSWQSDDVQSGAELPRAHAVNSLHKLKTPNAYLRTGNSRSISSSSDDV